MNSIRRIARAIKNVDKNPKNWIKGGVKLLRDTPIEIAMLGFLGLVSGFGSSWRSESNREKAIPLGFSEVSQVERKYKEAKEPVPPFTHHLLYANDAPMKAFECWNIANERSPFSTPYEMFADELQDVIGRNQHVYTYNLEGLLKILPERAKAAEKSFKEFILTSNQLQQPNSSFNSAWSESHVDHYVTVPCGTDKDGNTEYCDVYDHTTHSYTYRKTHGEAASKQLDAVLVKTSQACLQRKIVSCFRNRS